MEPVVTLAATIATTRTLIKSAKHVKDIVQGLDELFTAQEHQEKAKKEPKPKSRTQQIINIRAKEGDEALDDTTSLGSVAADVLEQEQVARNLRALQNEIEAKWGKGTFKKIQLERSKRIAHRVKVQREKKEEQLRMAEEQKSLWVKIGLEVLKAIGVIGFVAGGIYGLIILKGSQ